MFKCILPSPADLYLYPLSFCINDGNILTKKTLTNLQSRMWLKYLLRKWQVLVWGKTISKDLFTIKLKIKGFDSSVSDMCSQSRIQSFLFLNV